MRQALTVQPLLLVACLLWFALTPGRGPAEEKLRLELYPLAVLRAARSAEEARERELATPSAKGQAYAVLRAEFKDPAACKAFAAAGVHTLNRFDRFATLLIEFGDKSALDRLQALLDLSPDRPDADKPIVWLERAGVAKVPPPPPVRTVPERPRGSEEIVRGGIELPDGRRLTGKGVLVAVLDTGIDFRNPEFLTYEGEDRKPVSRLLYFWDTVSPHSDTSAGGPGPLLYPNKAPIGTLYKRADLNHELQAAEGRIGELDANGHGTACAEVAAGNGQGCGKEYTGVAPGVDLIGVRLASGDAIENEFLLGAVCEWLEDIAGDRPLVVSCSFSGHNEGHDGCTIEERELNARFSPARAGRALCIAAGNEAEDGLHARLELPPAGAEKSLEWLADAADGNRPTRALVHLFVDGARSSDVTWEGAKGLRLVEEYFNPLSKSQVYGFLVPAKGELRLKSKAAPSLVVDAYVSGLNGQVRFRDDLAVRSQLIGEPSLAAHAITVGSYDFNDVFPLKRGRAVRLPVLTSSGPRELVLGDLSSYSSPGHSRRGDLTKPDIVGPGQYYIVPAVKATKEQRDDTGKRTYFNGTSAATPYIAGVVALLLEKNPRLTLGEIKGLLHRSATARVAPVGKVPNEDWGFGKLDLAAVRRVVQATPAMR
jgi:subtilisin family serine protease